MTRTTRRSAFGVAAAAVVLLVMSACATDGGGVASAGGEATPGAVEDNTAALDADAQALAFAECMRDNGIDMPDPLPGQQGLYEALTHGAEGEDQTTVERAFAACQELAPQYDHGPDHDQEMSETRLAIAECLREKGFDVPDDLSGVTHDDLDQDDDLNAAMEECRDRIVGGGQ